jgi:hypothetical protein
MNDLLTTAEQLNDLALQNAQKASGALNNTANLGPAYVALYALSEGLGQVVMAQAIMIKQAAEK